MTSFTRRELLRGITFASGAALAASAGLGCGTSGDANGRVTLTQWYHQYGEAGTHDAVVRYAREYTRLNPKIAINVVWIPGDYNTKLATSLLTPQGPDIFEGALTAAMVYAGQVAALDDLMSPSDRADFTPADLDMNTVNGKLYGIKSVDDVGLLYYRKSLLEKAGVSESSLTSMAGLMDSAKRLTSGDRKGLFLGNDGGVTALLTLLPWSAGCEFLADNKIVFANPRTATAYDALRELNDSGSLLIGAPNDFWDPSAFVQELAAMQWTGLWAYPAIKKAFGEDVGAMPWPAFDAEAGSQPVTFLSGWSSMVNAQNRHAREAKQYLKWLWIEKNPLQRDWTLSYGFHVPPHVSLARTAEPLQAPVPAVAVRAAADHGRYLAPIWNQAMTTAMTDALSNVVKLGSPAAGELDVAARKCRRELERALE